MGCYIEDHRDELARRHYILKADNDKFWFNVWKNKLKIYQQEYGERFCLVLFREYDFYALPYREMAALFTEEFLDHRGRWVGAVRHDCIHVNRSEQYLPVKEYYNAYHLLGVCTASELVTYKDAHGQYLCAAEGAHARHLRRIAATHRTAQAARLRQVIAMAQEWAVLYADIFCLSEQTPLGVYTWLAGNCDELEKVIYERLGQMTYNDKILALSVASEELYNASACYREQTMTEEDES